MNMIRQISRLQIINRFSRLSVNIKLSDIVKLSIEELTIISGIDILEDAIEEIYQLGCKQLVITLGEKGSVLRNHKGLKFIKTDKVEMVDATGAGDAFIGSLIAMRLSSNKTMEEIVKIAIKDIDIKQTS